MSVSLLLISANAKDQKFLAQVTAANRFELYQSTDPEEIAKILKYNPNLLTFWAVDDLGSHRRLSEIILKQVKPHRIVAITEKPLEFYPRLLQNPTFGHHWVRRFEEPALELYSHIIKAAHKGDFFGLPRYFPTETPVKAILIKRPEHKSAAIQAIQNHLLAQGYGERVASVAAKATDELLMNSIMIAPRVARRDGMKAQNLVDAHARGVRFEIASCPSYTGIAITDAYGMLKKEDVFRSLGRQPGTKITDDASLGLFTVRQAGLNIMLTSRHKTQTQAMLFFPKAKTYRSMKSGMRFFSVVEQSKP